MLNLFRKRGLNKAAGMVAEFQRKFEEVFLPEQPTWLTQQEKELRLRLLREELQEFADAADMVPEVDALLDLMYIALGTLNLIGVQDIDALFEVVHKSNMEKLWSDGKPRRREDGKVIKPDGWTAPTEKLFQRLLEERRVRMFRVWR